MTIKRGRWAARVPGLRWGGQQLPRGPMVTLDMESFAFGMDFARDGSAFGMDFARDGSAFAIAVVTDAGFKVYPHQVPFIEALMNGEGNFSFQRGLDRVRAFERDFYKEAVENWRKSGLLKTALDEPDVTSQ